ncbi:MAG: chemotaxis protein CheD, partial [Pseudomonadota bacterium]
MTDVLEREKRVVSIVLGEYHATADPKTVVSTVLGSCIAACLCDPEAGVGGMNHFMLPDGDACSAHDQLRYGVNAMELLINELLRSGARRQKLEAKLFGGAHL